MTCISLSIAEIRFRISVAPGLCLEPAEQAYETFLLGDAQDAREEIPVSIGQGPSPVVEALPRIFDSGEAWSLYRDGDVNVFRSNPPPEPGKCWFAAFDDAVSRVDVSFGEWFAAPAGEGREVPFPVAFPLDQLLLTYRLGEGGSLFHGAGVELNGRGFLLAGHSGAGKTTIAREVLRAGNGTVFCDERVAVRRRRGGTFALYGVPGSGPARIARSGAALLSGIFFLAHGRENELRSLAGGEAMRRLLSLFMVPWYDRGPLERKLAFLDRLVSDVPAFELRFRPDETVVDFLDALVL